MILITQGTVRLWEKADEMLLPLLSASNGPVPFSLLLYLATIYDYGAAQPDGRQIGFSFAIPI